MFLFFAVEHVKELPAKATSPIEEWLKEAKAMLKAAFAEQAALAPPTPANFIVPNLHFPFLSSESTNEEFDARGQDVSGDGGGGDFDHGADFNFVVKRNFLVAQLFLALFDEGVGFLDSPGPEIMGYMILTLPSTLARRMARNCARKTSVCSRQKRMARQPRNGFNSAGPGICGRQICRLPNRGCG